MLDFLVGIRETGWVLNCLIKKQNIKRKKGLQIMCLYFKMLLKYN